jgi:hypothetical protein
MKQVEERVLIQKFKEATLEKKRLERDLKAAKKEYERIETQLIEILDAEGAEASARYEGIGYVRLMKPRLYASCNADNMEALFKHLEEVGRTDLIKTTVMSQTLSSYVKELIENGQEIPEVVSYYLKQSVKLYT